MSETSATFVLVRSALMRVLASAVTAGVSGVIAYLLRFDFQVPAAWKPGLYIATCFWVVVQPLLLYLAGWNRVGWNSISLPDLRILSRSILIAATGSTAAILLVRQIHVPRSVFVLQAVLVFLLSVGIRVAVRLYRERRDRLDMQTPQKRAVIYGAGSAGQALLRELTRKPQIGYLPVGFIDDRRSLHGQIVQGMPVLGDGVTLSRIAAQHKVDEVLIAMPSIRGQRLATVVSYCDQAGRPCKTIPGVEELIRRPERLTDFRQINLELLLGREPVQLDHELIAQKISGRSVMVTGAAGSIGSEVCRQVAAFSPSRLVAVDIAETPLFELENEFHDQHSECPFVAAIGDVRDETQMLAFMSSHRTEIVFHAAAYKHVPMMERHVSAAIVNNVLGTLSVVNAAERAAIRDFVMISTDKAVRPTSVMGATKRVAEMIVKSRGAGTTKFVSVRFGNVLGSNGSVVPVFQRQIRNGGPVTITHPEMRRYFMTIPEAAQLVLQAMALGTTNEIFVLDMGKPVFIGDLAHSLIALHGKVPGRDIALEYTGLRPGEKLFEELYLSDENLKPSTHEKILVLNGGAVDRPWIDACLGLLRRSLDATPDELREILRKLVPEYSPSAVPAQGSAGTRTARPEPKQTHTNLFAHNPLSRHDGSDAVELA